MGRCEGVCGGGVVCEGAGVRRNTLFTEVFFIICDQKYISCCYSFLINSSTGVIVTVVELDRESRPMPFELVVTATDLDGNPVDRNRGDAQVIINSETIIIIINY